MSLEYFLIINSNILVKQREYVLLKLGRKYSLITIKIGILMNASKLSIHQNITKFYRIYVVVMDK